MGRVIRKLSEPDDEVLIGNPGTTDDPAPTESVTGPLQCHSVVAKIGTPADVAALASSASRVASGRPARSASSK